MDREDFDRHMGNLQKRLEQRKEQILKDVAAKCGPEAAERFGEQSELHALITQETISRVHELFESDDSNQRLLGLCELVSWLLETSTNQTLMVNESLTDTVNQIECLQKHMKVLMAVVKELISITGLGDKPLPKELLALTENRNNGAQTDESVEAKA